MLTTFAMISLLLVAAAVAQPIGSTCDITDRQIDNIAREWARDNSEDAVIQCISDKLHQRKRDASLCPTQEVLTPVFADAIRTCLDLDKNGLLPAPEAPPR